MVIAGSDKTTRRRAGRRPRDPSPCDFGSDLRQARERLDLSLEAVQDRTGVRRSDLEALEEGDLSRFPDGLAALVAVRRYAQVLDLDADSMSHSVEEQWRAVSEPSTLDVVRRSVGAPQDPSGPSPAPVVGGHLSRYPGDSSHLRAFTQTAQVPQIGNRTISHTVPPGLRFDTTDAIPVTLRGPGDPRPAPLPLRVAVWSTTLLLVVGVAGLSIHHWRPAWLVKIHLVAAAGGAHPSHGVRPHSEVQAPVVTETASTPTAATVTVRSPVFQVMVATQAPCWIQATSPASFAPVFSATVPAATTKSFTSSHGRLSLELGASRVQVTVQVLGKTVPGWVLTPSTAPLFVNFSSAS